MEEVWNKSWLDEQKLNNKWSKTVSHKKSAEVIVEKGKVFFEGLNNL